MTKKINNPKYKCVDRHNLYFGEVVDAYSWAYNFLKQSYNPNVDEDERTTNPDDLTKVQIINYGIECLDQNEEYRRI